MLVAKKLGMPVTFPTLAAAKPIAGLLLVQVYVVLPPVFVVEKVMAFVEAPWHKIWGAIVLTWPNGLTIIVLVNGVESISVPNWIWEINKTTLVVELGTVIVPVPEVGFNRRIWFEDPFIE